MFWNKHKLYTVHMNPDHVDPFETTEFVKEGFNIYGFIFQGFWALYHRIWGSGFVLVVLMATILALAESNYLSLGSVMVLRLGFQAMIGFQANDLLRSHLDKQGYIMTDAVSGSSLLEAQQRYFDRKLSVNLAN